MGCSDTHCFEGYLTYNGGYDATEVPAYLLPRHDGSLETASTLPLRGFGEEPDTYLRTNGVEQAIMVIYPTA